MSDNILDMQRKTIRAYKELGSLNVFAQNPIYDFEPAWIREGAIMRLLVGLRDVLRLLDDAGLRITFADDFEEGDITDTVYKMRNAVCHTGSPSKDVFANTSVSLGIGYPGANCEFSMPGESFTICNPYSDDYSYHYGKLRLFHVRHIQRAITEAKEKLETLAKNQGAQLPSHF